MNWLSKELKVILLGTTKFFPLKLQLNENLQGEYVTSHSFVYLGLWGDTGEIEELFEFHNTTWADVLKVVLLNQTRNPGYHGYLIKANLLLSGAIPKPESDIPATECNCP